MRMLVGGLRVLEGGPAKDPQDLPHAGRGASMARETVVAVRRMLVRASSGVTLGEAASTWLDGRERRLDSNAIGRPLQASGNPRLRGGVAAPRQAEAWSRRLSEITRNDLQDLVDSLLQRTSNPRRSSSLSCPCGSSTSALWREVKSR